MMLSAGLSTQTLKAKGELRGVYQALKEKDFQPGMLYPARLSQIRGRNINLLR